MAADEEAAKAALHPAAPQPRAKEQRLGQCGARSFCCLLRAKQLLLSDSLWFQSVVLCHSEANVYLSSQDTLLLSIPWVHAETGKEGLLGGPGGSSQWLKAVSGAGWQHPLIHPAEPSDPRRSDMIARLQPADALTHAHTYIHTCMQRPATSPRERAWQSKAASSQPCMAPHGRRTDGQTDRRRAAQQGSGQPLSSRRCRLRIVCPQAPSGGKSSPVERRGIHPSVRDGGTAAQSAPRLPNSLVMHCVPMRLLREINVVEFVSTDGGRFSLGHFTDTSRTSPRQRPHAADNAHGEQA